MVFSGHEFCPFNVPRKRFVPLMSLFVPMKTIKEPIKIRTKKLEDGVESIYLDIYSDGKRKKEYLKLYLLPETDKESKRKNKETLTLVNAIKVRKMMELQEGKYDFKSKKRAEIDLVEFIEETYEEYLEKFKPRTARLYKNILLHTRKFLGRKKVQLKDVDKDYVRAFIAYLWSCKTRKKEQFKEDTVRTYYVGFVRVMNRAVEEELIQVNPCNLIKSTEAPKKAESTRVYLTFDEVRRLIDTPCSIMIVKQLFLFSCFTGLRIGDILRLKRSNLVEVEKGTWQLEFIQQKTEKVLTVPLSKNAMAWIPEERKGDKLFGYYMTSNEYYVLAKWVKAAGITKHVTFHVARHTYATLLLYFGADVYTVSKLLGHTSVKTTQIYAKVVDESKRKAVSLIPEIE